MEFTASVVYNEGKYVVVQVVAVDVSPVNVIRTKTNILTYVFRTKDGASANALPKVVPSTYEEIVLYLEGKRALDQWFEEQKQYY